MMRKESKAVNNFAVGDKIIIYGNTGVVIDIDSQNVEGANCTYLQVQFDKNTGLNQTPYDLGWYGGKDNIVSYGCIK